MEYMEIKIITTEEGCDIISANLLDVGIDSVVINSKNNINDLLDRKEYMWNYIDQKILDIKDSSISMSFYIEKNEKGNKLLESVKNIMDKLRTKDEEYFFNPDEKILGDLTMSIKEVSDEDWKDKWKEYFKPLKITDHLVIKPSWEKYDKKKDEMIIEIDPGMAFGTGTHETTSMVLKLIEKYLDKGNSFLDVGCGSGILSIAAALLGAGEIHAVDIDPIACEVSRDNIKINGFDNKIDVECLDLTEGFSYKSDVIVANLIAELVVYLSEYVMENMNDNGIFISSGILTEKKEMVTEALYTNGYEILETMTDGEWCAIAAKHKGKK